MIRCKKNFWLFGLLGIACVLVLMIINAGRNKIQIEDISQYSVKYYGTSVLQYLSQNVANKYKVTINKVESHKRPKALAATHIISEDFYKLSTEEMASFFKDIFELTSYQKIEVEENAGKQSKYTLYPGSSASSYSYKKILPDGEGLTIVSGNHNYRYLKDDEDIRNSANTLIGYNRIIHVFFDDEWIGEQTFRHEYEFAKSSSSSTSGSSVKCSNCNGTGTVKYYYGSSALDAALAGQDNYSWGPCGMCNGSGYTKKSGSSSSSTSNSSGVTCPSCGKNVSSLKTQSDAAGMSHSWCNSCWSSYNSIMGR